MKDDSNTEKREAIVQAMLELITERGFHATPMSMVAEKAGVAAGTIYHHFGSKDEIIHELHSRLKSNMGRALRHGDMPAEEYRLRFSRIWISLFDHFVANPQEYLFLEQFTNSPFHGTDSKASSRQYDQPVLDFLAEGVWSGILRNMESGLLLALFYGSVNAAVRLHLSGELEMTADRVNQVVQSAWDGLRMD